MRELRVLVADDERMARDRMVRLLTALGVDVVACCERGDEVLEALTAGGIDAVFLDLDMPGHRGNEIAEQLAADGPLVVFATAHRGHAVEAFEQGAVDYLLKPISRTRLSETLQRLRARLAQGDALTDHIAIPTARGIRLVGYAELLWCNIEGESVAVHTDSGTLFTSWRLSELERRLPAQFWRVHRQALVHLHRVVELRDTPSGGYLARLDNDDSVEVSRATARRLRRVLLAR